MCNGRVAAKSVGRWRIREAGATITGELEVVCCAGETDECIREVAARRAVLERDGSGARNTEIGDLHANTCGDGVGHDNRVIVDSPRTLIRDAERIEYLSAGNCFRVRRVVDRVFDCDELLGHQ